MGTKYTHLVHGTYNQIILIWGLYGHVYVYDGKWDEDWDMVGIFFAKINGTWCEV